MSDQAISPTLKRLEDQIDWYDRRSGRSQRFFKSLMIAEMICGAMVPLFAGLGARPLYTGMLGVAIVLLQGIQQLNQYQHNWITYRSTCETLKHEKYLYLANAGPYANSSDPLQILADRIEAEISQEHAKWVAAQKQISPRSTKDER